MCITGKYYLKLGCFHEHTTLRLTSADQIKDVFCGQGDPAIVKSTARLIQDVVKGNETRRRLKRALRIIVLSLQLNSLFRYM